MQHGHQRRCTGACDRPRRQADILIGIIGRRNFRVAVEEILLRLIEQILYRRVGLQRHTEAQALQKDLRDDRAILIMIRLLLHEGCERYEFIDREVHLLGAVAHLLRQAMIEILCHHRHDRVGIERIAQLIGVGEKEPLCRITHILMLLYIGIGAKCLGALHKVIRAYKPFLFQPLGDLLHAEPLRNHEADRDGIAIDEFFQRITRRHPGLHGERTGLDLVFKSVQLRRPPELHLAVDHTAFMQFLADAADTHPGAYGKVHRRPLIGGRGGRRRDQKRKNKEEEGDRSRPAKYHFLLLWGSLSAVNRPQSLLPFGVLQKVACLLPQLLQ